MYMYAYIVLYSISHSSDGYWWNVLSHNPLAINVFHLTNFFPKYLFLKEVTVSSFSSSIRPFFIDTKTNLVIAPLVIFSRDFFHENISVGSFGFTSVILLQNRSMPLTFIFRLWYFSHFFLICYSYQKQILLQSYIHCTEKKDLLQTKKEISEST